MLPRPHGQARVSATNNGDPAQKLVSALLQTESSMITAPAPAVGISHFAAATCPNTFPLHRLAFSGEGILLREPCAAGTSRRLPLPAGLQLLLPRATLVVGDVAAAAQVRAVRHPGPPNALALRTSRVLISASGFMQLMCHLGAGACLLYVVPYVQKSDLLRV